MIDATHMLTVQSASDASDVGGLTEGIDLADPVEVQAVLQGLTSQKQADKFGVEITKRYLVMVDLGDETALTVGASVSSVRLGVDDDEPVRYRVETESIRHEAGDECDYAEAILVAEQYD